MEPQSSHRPKRDPVTIDHLRALHYCLYHTNTFDITVWHKECLSSAKGHGFQIGGIMHLLLLGVNLWIVMVQGHWSSQQFLSYWQKCEEILSLFPGFSFQSCESILSIMSTFKNSLSGKQ